MIDYSDFTVERFVMDEAFQRHVKHPTRESTLFWNQWLAHHPHKTEEFHQARLLVLSIDFRKTPESKIPKAALLERIQSSIRTDNSRTLPNTRSFLFRYQRIAAVFLGLMLATVSLYFLTGNNRITETTAYGEIRQLTLPDGSEMVLNANSSVQFSKSWTSGEPREVMLNGEAFFDIVHKRDHEKFIVRTDEAAVEVLGTEFNVQARRERTKVVLSSGKVKLSRTGADGAVFMEPGDMVEVARGQREILRTKVDPAPLTSWTKNQLIFKATPLGEIAQTLEDHFGWTIDFEEESIKAYQFTGAVSTESVDDVEALLFTISESFNLGIDRNNDQLTFSKK